MRCQNGNTQYVLVTAEPLKQIIQIFTIQRPHQPLAKVAGLLHFFAKGVTLLTVCCMNLLDAVINFIAILLAPNPLLLLLP